MQNWVVESIATLEIVCIKIEFLKKNMFYLCIGNQIHWIKRKLITYKAMINKTKCAQKWVAESKAKLTLKLNVALFCYIQERKNMLLVLILWVLLVIKDYTHQLKSINNLVFKKWSDVWN